MTKQEERALITDEIQRRLDILGYDVNRMYQYLLVPKDPETLTCDLVLYFDAADLGPEGDETMIIQNIETNYGVKVYAAITTQCGELGKMLTLLLSPAIKQSGSASERIWKQECRLLTSKI